MIPPCSDSMWNFNIVESWKWVQIRNSFLHGNFHMDHHNKSSDAFQQPTDLETSRNPDLHRLLQDSGTDKHTQLVKWNFLQISRKSQLSECHWNHLRLLELLGCFDFLQTAFPSMLDPFITGRRTGCVWKLRNCNFWEGNLWVFNVEKFGDTSNKRPICWTKKPTWKPTRLGIKKGKCNDYENPIFI